MMRRAYSVRAHTAPGIDPPAAREQSGGFAYGAWNAARDYARDTLPGYDVIPGGRLVAPGVRAFDAIDYAGQRGAVLWVREA